MTILIATVVQNPPLTAGQVIVSIMLAAVGYWLYKLAQKLKKEHPKTFHNRCAVEIITFLSWAAWFPVIELVFHWFLNSAR